MNKKIVGVLIVLVILLFSQTVFADQCTDCASQGKPCNECGQCKIENGVCVDKNWWESANNFWNGQTSDIAKNAMESLDDIVNMIHVIGNMAFIIVTVVLGVKYIWGGVEAKAGVKDSLTTLIVSALVFYGWSTISSLFLNEDRNNLVFITDNYKTTADMIYNIILYVLDFLAVGGIVYIGIRYMMAGAEGRAQLKTKGVPIVLGLIMVYATWTFLNFIVKFKDIIPQ